MRAPNGYGTVYKLSGKRRRPWVVRVTVGYKPNDNGGLSPIVHYVPTKPATNTTKGKAPAIFPYLRNLRTISRKNTSRQLEKERKRNIERRV